MSFTMSTFVRERGVNGKYRVSLDKHTLTLPGLPEEPTAQAVAQLAEKSAHDYFRVGLPKNTLTEDGRAVGKGTTELRGKDVAHAVRAIAGITSKGKGGAPDSAVSPSRNGTAPIGVTN